MSSLYNLLIAACKGDKNKMREAQRDGADANAQDEGGWTALMVTALHGGEHGAGMMRLLVAAGADANKQDEYGETALMYAAQYGGKHGAGMMRALVDAKADTNKQDGIGCTALIYAALQGGEHAEAMMRLLIDAGADANKQSKYGWTALMSVARHVGKYSDKIIYVLVNAGADINIKDINNKTAYDIAVRENNTLAVNILQQYKDNWIFNPKIDIQLGLWSTQNIQSVRDIHTSWKGDEDHQSGFGKLPWEIIRDIILPMTIDRKDTVKLIKKKKEEEEEKRISSRPCKKAKNH